MDTSKEYIFMCEKAIELQNDWLKGWSFYTVRNFRERLDEPVMCRKFTYISEEDIEDFIWLPRQDQLQDMVEGEFYGKIYSVYAWMQINRVSGHNETMEVEYCNSMEQLWLGYIMSEKYNKEWNIEKKEWEKRIRNVKMGM